jgi:hypothetical protein
MIANDGAGPTGAVACRISQDPWATPGRLFAVIVIAYLEAVTAGR